MKQKIEDIKDKVRKIRSSQEENQNILKRHHEMYKKFEEKFELKKEEKKLKETINDILSTIHKDD